MSYSDVSGIHPTLDEISFFDVKEGQNILYHDRWYKALEDALVNDGMVGFRAETEEFGEVVIQTSKNDMGYAPKLFTERTPSPTDAE